MGAVMDRPQAIRNGQRWAHWNKDRNDWDIFTVRDSSARGVKVEYESSQPPKTIFNYVFFESCRFLGLD